MDVFASHTGSLLHEDCSLNSDGSCYLQGPFIRKCSLLVECKNSNPAANLKDQREFVSKDRGDGKSILDSDIEVSLTQDLRHALEADLNIDLAEKNRYCSENQSQVLEEFSCKDEKKNKWKGPPENPKLNFAAYNDEQNKSSIDIRESMMGKTLLKCATFPCTGQLSPSSIDEVNAKAAMHDHESLEMKDTVYARSSSLPSSFKLISAMRGGHEQNGLGPRPKLSVKWAPDVQEPRLSSISHTVRSHRRHQSKKKDHKHKHKGKSSHASGANKNDKKHFSKRSYNSEGGHSRLRSSSSHGNRILLDVWASKSSILLPDKSHLMALEAPIFNMQMGLGGITLDMPSRLSEHCFGDEEDEFVEAGSSDAEFPLLQGSKCASSFRHTLQSKHLSCAEAA